PRVRLSTTRPHAQRKAGRRRMPARTAPARPHEPAAVRARATSPTDLGTTPQHVALRRLLRRARGEPERDPRHSRPETRPRSRPPVHHQLSSRRLVNAGLTRTFHVEITPLD